VSDNNNCGGCGITCGPGTTCAGQRCVMTEILRGCSTSSPVTVLVKGASVTAYVANGHWDASFLGDQLGGVQVVPLEGGGAQSPIETPSMVNNCAANAVTDEVVCVANTGEVYTLEGSSLTETLHSSGNIATGFTDGGGYNTGVVIDAATNRAAISIGITSAPVQHHAYQFLDLGTRTFETPIPVLSIAPESYIVDPVRHSLFSASEDGAFTLLDTTTEQASYWHPINSGTAYFDTSGEDCQTGIAVGVLEDSDAIVLADLTQAAYSGTNWSAPFTVPNAGNHDGFALAQGSHLALGFAEYGSSFTVFRFPSTSGSGAPALVDYASSSVSSFLSSYHGLGAYVSPANGRAYGVVSSFDGTRLAMIDLQGVLDAPRYPLFNQDPAVGYSHNVSVDLVGTGVVKFLPILGHPYSANNPSAQNPVLGTTGTVSILGNDPAGEATLTYVWSASGPAPVVFTPNGTNAAKNSTATFTAPGHYTFTVTFTDAHGFTASRQVSTDVVRTYASFAVQPTTLTLTSGENAPINVSGTDQFGNPFMTAVTWSQASGPTGGAATFGNLYAATTTVSFTLPGSYTIQARAGDSYTPTRTATISVTVLGTGADLGAPPDLSLQTLVVNAGPNQTITLPVSSVTLNGTVTDNNGNPPSVPFTSSWAVVNGPGTVVFADASKPQTTATFGAVGVYVLSLTATDAQGPSSANVTITVNPASSSQPPPPTCSTPTVAISSPADGSEITTRTDVVGSVSAGAWTLQYVLGGDESTSPPVTICSGTNAVANARLCTFDPTLLLNGTYSLRLTSACSGGSATASVGAMVTRNQKVGVSRVAFNDLNIPVAGIPIRVTRTYDSRNKSNSGDFGFGWNVDLGKSVRVQKSAGLGKWWVETSTGGIFPTYCLQPSRALFVTVTFSSGKVYRFQATTEQPCQQIYPITDGNLAFTPIAPTQGSLIALNGVAFQVSGSPGGGVQLYDASTFTLLNPTQFQLTAEDGTKYIIDQFAGLQQVTDRNGNTLSISPSGIVSSTGKGAAFNRDGQGRITSIVDPSGSFLSYTYDASGNLASAKDRTGNITTFEYDADHNLVAINDPRGLRDVEYIYDSDGRLVGSTDANGHAISYAHNLGAQEDVITDQLGNVTIWDYDADGNIVKETDALGGVTLRTFDAHDNKLSETNPLGNTTKYTYDSSDNQTSVTDPLGHVTTTSYALYSLPATSTDALGFTITYSYDAQGNLLSTKDWLGGTVSNGYNLEGLQRSQTDALGGVTFFEYDNSGNLSRKTDALGNATSYAYDPNGNRIMETRTRTVGNGTETLVTTYTYDAEGRQTSITYPDGTTTRTAYNSLGKQSSTTNQLGRTTTYDYDASGNVVRTTYPDQTTEIVTNDAVGRVNTRTDRGGRTTSHSYDALGNVLKTIFADGTIRTNSYDAASQLAAITDEIGNTTRLAYDTAGRRTSITDPLGHATLFGYDAVGNQTSITDANGHITMTAYDANRRATRQTYADGSFSTIQYDANGSKIAETDAAGVTTKYGYDLKERLTQVTDGLRGVTSYGYDELDNRISQTDANGHTTLFAYDRLGRRVKRTLPLGQSETFSYDAAGNLQSKTDFNSRTTLYSHDASDRLTSKTPDIFFDTPLVNFSYTPTGRLAAMVDATGVTSYTYDQRDRVLSKSTAAGTLTYTYDPAGRRSSLRSDAVDGVAVDYTWDAAGRLASVTDRTGGGTTSYHYDAAGHLAGYAYPNGIASTLTYDSLNRLSNVSLATSGNNPLAAYAYTFDAVGNRLSLTEASGRTDSWSYDSVYRLTNDTIAGGSDARANGSISYVYDAVGNRTARTSSVPAIASTTSMYDHNDRLNTDSYDAEGNTTASGTSTYRYDFEDHLTSANTGQIVLVYDGQGTLVRRAAGSVVTAYLIDDGNPTGYAQIVEERVGGSVSRAFVFGRQLVSERQKLGGVWTRSSYGYDGHGDVRLLLADGGAITDTYDYDAFGNLLSSTGSTPNDHRYAGERFDSALGLEYLRARYLSSATGRFITSDPFETDPEILLPFHAHAYSYADQNPVNRRDPTGWFSEGEIEVVQIGEEAIQSAARVNAFKVVGIVLSAGAIGAQTLGPPGSPRQNPSPYQFRMRVQLQQSPYGGGGVTLNTEGFPIEQATSIPVSRVRTELTNVFRAASTYLDWFPSDGLRDLRSAIIDVSKKLGNFPPNGIAEGRLSIVTSKFDYRKDYEFRVDVDNLAGWNLRN